MSSASEERKVEDEKQFIIFNIENTCFGINVLDVKEITADFKITPVFHSPEALKGYVNLRGEIFLILDLRTFLGLDKHLDDNAKLIIFKKRAADSFGIIVDQVSNVIKVSDKDFEKLDGDNSSAQLQKLDENQIIEGVCKLDDELMVTLDARKIYALLGSSND